MGIVYILTNPEMPNVVKIGSTKSPKTFKDRLQNLSRATGVPVPFKCVARGEFGDKYKEVEKTLHKAFGDRRVSKNKEFFRVDPDQPIAILEQFGKKEVSLKTKDVAPERSEKKKNFKFHMVDIGHGSTLASKWDEEITCTVHDDRRVLFRGEKMTLTRAAQIVYRESGKEGKVGGPASWKYEGKVLSDLRDEVEG